MEIIPARRVIPALGAIRLPTRGKNPRYLITSVPDKDGTESPLEFTKHRYKGAQRAKKKSTQDEQDRRSA